ncbi:hypothetical protein E0Z10_g9789 [Xylaria hypoxylon]|uniref:Uncharacterized protein n=1 Tax=Xylaria hypoxylon TaxID=37992 RepID=A0A4Z0Y5C0_9PEZI|nr:hypothetical protein E0Z10_g9789 [Xylaria hypoxylon]
MNFAQPPDDTPKSPWAERFTVQEESRDVLTWDNLKHSGYAPEIPRVNNPIHYLNISDLIDQLAPNAVPSDGELDKLLRTEDYQNDKLRGIVRVFLWRAYATDVGDAAKAIGDIYNLTKLRVDETRWFGFFRKDRWYDWIQTSPPAKAGGLLWSVDDPNVWRELSMCLELADRALKALIEDKNDHAMLNFPRQFRNSYCLLMGYGTVQLQTILYGRIEKWEDVVPRRDGDDPPPSDARVLLSLYAEEILAKVKGEPCQFNYVAGISKSQWRQRLEEILTTYKWIIHELCHGIIGARDQNNIPGEVRPNIERAAEPTLMVFAKLATPWSKNFFGGSTTVFPLLADIPIAVLSYEVPSALYMNHPSIPGDWQKDDAEINSTYTPASWTSRLLSEAFWNDPAVPQKSADYFHRPFIFSNSTRWGGGPQAWGAVEPDPDDHTLATMTNQDKQVLETWNERHQIWIGIREVWYDEERYKWENSPWAQIEWRIKIDLFAAAFAKRDEVACAQIATELVHRINWSEDRNTYIRYLPKNDRDLSPWWVLHCIGLLMMASIPIRDHPNLERSQMIETNWTYSAAPSLEAAAAGERYAVRFVMEGTQPKDEHGVNRSEYFDQVNETGQKVNDITQYDYLGLTCGVVNEVARYAPMYAVWVGSIMEAQIALREDRVSIQRNYLAAHSTRWASNWVYKIPKYNQRVIRVVNNVTYDMKWNKYTWEWELAP